MRDRVPTPGRENRVKITQDDGTVVAGVLEYDDQATQEGSPYTKGNVLPDDVCGILGLDSNTAEPKDAWIGVMHALGYSILIITALEVDGSPLSNFQVSGLPDTLIESKTYTDDNGKLFVIIPEGSYTLSIPDANCIDATVPNKEVTVSAGVTQNVTMQQTKVRPAKKTITSSQTVRFSSNVASVDVFCCGGGGGGGGGDDRGKTTSGGGGGGGYTATGLEKTITPYSNYTATIGSGGGGGNGISGESGNPGKGRTGGSTSFLGVSAPGGTGGGDGNGSTRMGGDGGSGGGSGAASGYSGSDGGSDGSNGEETSHAAYPGSGQGTTTRAFGESSGTLCSGGGGGGAGGSNGAGTYGQGGQGGSKSGSDGSSGRAGVVMIRWVNKT